MQQTGFWANVGLLVTSLILLLAWGMLPLFTTTQPAVIEGVYNSQQGELSVAELPPSMAFSGSTVAAQLDVIDMADMSNDTLFQTAWGLVVLAGIGGVVSGLAALWRPALANQAAFAGVACGVVSLVCLGFLRFQYGNMTATALFDTTAVGWWVLVVGGIGLVGQGILGRPRRKIAIVVPQPPPFLPQSPQEIFAAIPTELSAAMLTAPRLRLIHLGTNQVYALDLSRTVSIGRGRQNDVVLVDEKVSRRHAIIWWHAGWVMIANQSQHAPLYLNQQPIEGEYPVRLGDTITLGQTHLRLTSE